MSDYAIEAKHGKFNVTDADGNTVPDGEHETRESAEGHLRLLAGKSGRRNSAPDQARIQSMHDMAAKMHSEALAAGAECDCEGDEVDVEEYEEKETEEDGDFTVKHYGPGDHASGTPQSGRIVSISYPTGKIKIYNSHSDTTVEQDVVDVNTGNPRIAPASKSLDLSYVKSLGLLIPAEQLAVKYVGKDTVKGYTFLWGNPQRTDIEREYFTKSTNFWDDKLGASPRPLTWDHNQDSSLKASPVVGEIREWGDDEVGRWYLAKLDRAHRYRKAVDALIEQRLLGTSADSAPQYVTRVKTGKSTWLKEWAWFASALTECPAEPRMIGTLDYFKSIGLLIPEMGRETDRASWEKNKRMAQLLKIKPQSL